MSTSTCSVLEERPEYAPLPNPESRRYLTTKAEYALRFPRKAFRSSEGFEPTQVSLYQITMTGMIILEEVAANYFWPYKAEVSYDMTTVPPKPFLSTSGNTKTKNPDESNISEDKPSAPVMLFPEILGNVTTGTLDPNRRHSHNPFPKGLVKGFLRRPDVTLVFNPTLRWPGLAGPDHEGIMHPDNITRIIEVKFPGDSLSPTQEKAYQKIAGDERRFTVLDVVECEPEKKKEPVKTPVIVPVPQNKMDRRLQPVPVYSPQPMSDPAWYEEWAKSLEQHVHSLIDELQRGFHQLSEAAQKWLSEIAPWVAGAGKWVQETAHGAWVWIDEQGRQLARWTEEQLRAAWAKISEFCDLAWETIKAIDWAQVLLTVGKVVAVVVVAVVVVVGVIALETIAIPAELLAGLLAILALAVRAGAAAMGAILAPAALSAAH